MLPLCGLLFGDCLKHVSAHCRFAGLMPTRSIPVRSSSRSRASRPRPDLSRALILETALELIDAKGLEALNMRDLGLALGAATMSVYRHFRNKAELLDAVVDRVVAEFAPAGPQRDWRIEARDSSQRVRRAMLAHPELADLIGREFRRSGASLKVNIQIIDRLRAGGVPEVLLPDVYWTLSSYTTGFALLEAHGLRRRGGAAAEPSLARRRSKIASLLAQVEDAPPEAIEAAASVLARPLDEAQFDFGLASLIRGLADIVSERPVRHTQP